MPIARVNGINISYQIEGHGEPLVMIAGLAMDTVDRWTNIPIY